MMGLDESHRDEGHWVQHVGVSTQHGPLHSKESFGVVTTPRRRHRHGRDSRQKGTSWMRLGSFLLLPSLVAYISPLVLVTMAEAANAEGGGDKKISKRIESLLSSMDLQDKLGQMSQIDIAAILTADKQSIDLPKTERLVGQLGVGSVFNAPLADDVNGHVAWDAATWRKNVKSIQDVAAKYRRPPILMGLDSVHGANYVKGAIMTPQQINIAATFDTKHAYLAGKLASRDTRASGLNWLFAPILGIALQPNWARVYETFGEDMHLASRMGVELIRGIQEEEDANVGAYPAKAAACAKHFLGYSMPRTGHDRSPAWIPTRHLRQYFLPSFRAAIQEAGVKTVMSSYSEVDGVPMTSNHETTVDLLRHELGFDGVLVTDFEEIYNLNSWHSVARDHDEAVKLALGETSVDMSMIPFDVEGFQESATSAVEGKISYPTVPGNIPLDRIDMSAQRILQLKEELGMFDATLSVEDVNVEAVGSAEDREVALTMARDSLILVKNDNGPTLPMTKGKRVFVTGPTSDSIRFLAGGWTKEWQGAPEDSLFTYGTTILGGIADISSRGEFTVTSSCGVDTQGDWCDGSNSIETAVDMARRSDYTIVCVGEENYTEKPGDIRDSALPVGQRQLVRDVSAAAKSGGGKVILVVVGGRPRILGEMVDDADAILLAFLPGPDGGKAIADVLTGRHNPTGRLPMTYPKYQDMAGSPYFHAPSSQCTRDTGGPMPHYGYVPCEVQWPFGHGLSYTTFEYTNLQLSGQEVVYPKAIGVSGPDFVTVSVTVMNVGTIAGSEAVLFFTFDESRYVTPEDKRLRSFEKVSLQPGESRVVTANVTIDDLRHVGPHDDKHLVLQDGMRFRIGVGYSVDCRVDRGSPLCTDFVTTKAGSGYVGSCDVACAKWEESDCTSVFNTVQVEQCRELCHAEEGGRGWGWNYAYCVESVSREVLGGGRNSDNCWKMTSFCRDVFQTGQVAQEKVNVAPNGHHPSSRHNRDDFQFILVLSTVSGFVGALFIIASFRKKTTASLGADDSVEFSRITEGLT